MEKKSIVIPIYIGKSDTLNGIRCLKAARDIKKDEIIEACPIILLPLTEFDSLDKTVLRNYEFEWDDENEAMVIGYGSLFNHSFQPNVFYTRDFKTKSMTFFAARDIKKDEELFTNYNGNEEPFSPIDEELVNFKY
jgi:SET domain-containing protein